MLWERSCLIADIDIIGHRVKPRKSNSMQSAKTDCLQIFTPSSTAGEKIHNFWKTEEARTILTTICRRVDLD